MKINLALASSCVALVVCIGVKIRIQRKLETYSRKSVALEVVNAGYYGQSLKRYSFGFNNVIADLIWIDLLQHASHEKLDDGKVSWEYAQLEAITTLDPSFMRPYSFGASFLSVFRQDKLGAKLILEKWVNRDPTYWHSRYILGYHLFYEMRDFEAAAPQILRAAELPGAPSWLTSLGVRILSESGALANALKISIDLYDTVQASDDGRDRLAGQIRALRFAVRKKAFEDALDEFRATKKHEPSSLAELQPFIPEPVRKLASEAESNRGSDELKALLAEEFAFYYDVANRRVASRKSEKELNLAALGVHWNATPKKKGK